MQGPERIDALVHDLVEHSARAGDIVQGAAVGEAMEELRRFMFERVYLGATVRAEAEKITGVLRSLFDHYADHPWAMPDGGGVAGADLGERVTDYLAGMTDRYCIRAWQQLATPQAFAR